MRSIKSGKFDEYFYRNSLNPIMDGDKLFVFDFFEIGTDVFAESEFKIHGHGLVGILPIDHPMSEHLFFFVAISWQGVHGKAGPSRKQSGVLSTGFESHSGGTVFE